jgi:hypothetical protein
MDKVQKKSNNPEAAHAPNKEQKRCSEFCVRPTTLRSNYQYLWIFLEIRMKERKESQYSIPSKILTEQLKFSNSSRE